ncbi:XdhC family protein [Parasphingopyxis marina]|uniref:XdhC family protein n=1 Tax=Parasphingopyxis marina TaxID=2761622 RepID=A0A842I0A2_9SPHN|nr:XdhC family protein [Parasphingopyxis marina]MBC2778069.1 XdhC family protein [Parasphingopyxis marina]
MNGDLDRLLARAAEWRGAKTALATVLSTWGSAPRPRGSHMLIHEDGRFAGSVSGGCVEGEVLQAAAEVIADGRFRQLTFGVADESAWDVGLPCGGKIAILVQPVGDDGFAPMLFDRIAEARTAGQSLSLSTNLQTGLTHPGAREEDWDNIYTPPRRLLIVGAVQIAQHLARIAREIDVAPTVIDPRARFLTAERFPDTPLDDRWPDEAIAAHKIDSAAAIVTLSHDPKIDDAGLIAALATPAAYIAALGSQKSHAARIKRLREAGISEENLARMDAPAGLPIGAMGPAEIALSIAAGMVAAFAQKEPWTRIA